jgi:hypothetical protein
MSCDTLQVVATVVSALAALGAVVAAVIAIQQTRDARTEERLHRLASLVAELGFAMNRGAQGDVVTLHSQIPLLQARLAGALGSSAEFPAAHEMAGYTEQQIAGADELAEGQTTWDLLEQPRLTLERIEDLTTRALAEIADRFPD